MSIEDFQKWQAEMPTTDLLEKAREYIRENSKNYGKRWKMSIPPQRSDCDMVFGEVCRRLEIAANFDKSFTLVNAAQTLLEELEETHAALCFTGDYVGSLRYEKNKAAIARAKKLKP